MFPPGSHRPIAGSLLEQVLRGETIYREDMRETRFYEESELVRLGLHCRVVAPLLAGARAIGMISVVRKEPRSFTQEEVELLSLLGRFVATAVENIRAYDAERTTVEELRRLSALRADFVSLVSHELRSPMATVIGSARTLQQRWRELKPEQRESFLALIADETNRLATLVADVLDTSRIEAGTFSYTFADVDLAELLRDVVAAAEIGQDEVPLATSIADPVPPIRGDRERLRQVLANLVENAVKYSPSGEPVEVSATALNGNVVVTVRDRGPGIAERRPVADLREVRPRAFGEGASGDGPRPLHRALDRGGARRHARRALGAHRGRDLHTRVADRLRRARRSRAALPGRLGGAKRPPSGAKRSRSSARVGISRPGAETCPQP